MLLAADAGFLFHPPENVRAEFPQLAAYDTYEELRAALIERADARVVSHGARS